MPLFELDEDVRSIFMLMDDDEKAEMYLLLVDHNNRQQDDHALTEEEIDLVLAGKVIQAIKSHRQRTRNTLKYSKDIVDKYVAAINKLESDEDDETICFYYSQTSTVDELLGGRDTIPENFSYTLSCDENNYFCRRKDTIMIKMRKCDVVQNGDRWLPKAGAPILEMTFPNQETEETEVV